MENLLMGGAPQGQPQGMGAAPQAPEQPQATPEQVATARSHMGVVMKGLMGLARKPKGSLTKRDLYNAIGEMIAEGAFPTPEAKQKLVAQIAQIPDDETAIRQAIGSQLLQMGAMRERFHQQYGLEG